MEIKEFKVKTRNDLTFRNKKLNTIEVLSLQTQIDLNNFKKTNFIFNYILENVEVSIDGVDWLPLKEKNKEIYYPKGIEEDLITLNKVITHFLNEILRPLFLESSK